MFFRAGRTVSGTKKELKGGFPVESPVVIKENRVFRRLYGRGKSFVSPVLVTYVARTRTGQVRYGITTGKKIGIAVARSRARRVIRAAFRAVAPEIAVGAGVDLVFVARHRTCVVKSQEVEAAMRAQLKKAGVLP